MFYSNTLNLIQVGGGTQVKQGDLGSRFSYKLANEKEQELDNFNEEVAHINLVLDDKIVFTTTATVDNSTVTFNIDKAIPVGLYFLEIKIRDYIFPSDKQTIIFVQSGAVAYDLKELVPNYDTNMTLNGILSDLSQKGIDISDLKRRMAEKVNKDEVTNVMTPKGTLAYASLPTSGNQVGWYYYCPDGDGTHGAGNYVWNGTSWYFGGTGDEGYNLLKEDLVNSSMYEKINIDIMKNIKEVVNGKYLDLTTGTVQTNVNYSYGFVYDVVENDLITLVKDNGFSGWVTCHDSSGTYISGFQISLGSTKKLPSGTYKIGITYKTGKEPIISNVGNNAISKPVGEHILSQKEKISNNLLNTLGYRNRLDDITDYIDGIAWYNGLTIVNENFKSQNTIYVKGIKKLYARSGSVFVNFYNENMKYIAFAGESEVDVPTNACFASISCNKNTSVVCDLSLLDDDYYLVNDELKNFENYVGFKNDELLNKSTMVDGKYVDSTTGVLANLSSFTASDYIRVIPNFEYIVSGGGSASQVAFYDLNKSYISGVVTNENGFKIPNNSNIVYMRWCTRLTLKDYASIKLKSITSKDDVVVVNSSGSILDGVIEAYSKGIKKVYIEDGTYDIISEYESHFGSDCFDNYSSSNDYNYAAMNVYGRGIWLEDIEIVFSPSAKVIANYTGSNNNVITKFSPFAVGNNVIIDGLVMESTDLRYGIHADFNTGDDITTFILKNCDLKHIREDESGLQQCIGAGLGVHVHWEFINNIFRSTNNNAVFRIHNNISENAESKVIIKDCYIVGDGFMTVRSYGSSTSMTQLLVSNCSWKTPISVVREDGGTVDNIELYSWNNETRS